MRVRLSSVLEFVGAVCVLFAAGAWDWRAGLAVLGVALVVVSYVIDGEVTG